MKKGSICGMLAFALAAGFVAAAQEPPKAEAVLRFDEAKQEAAADIPLSQVAADTAGRRPFAYKLNRRRVSEAKAYDAVTLWNVRRVRIKNRRMRLSDSTRREKVRLLKFFTERDRRKGARPHLLGNVAGYTWSERICDGAARKWRDAPRHISTYTLRSEYDSVRLAGGEVSLFDVPRELWRQLSPEAVYVLDGERVPAGIFQFIDGLILRTLEIHTDSATMARYATAEGVVMGDIYPDRTPLVVVEGTLSSIEEWLKMCQAGFFGASSAVPMRYYYMLPLEAVQLYGRAGKFGAICIEMAE